MTGEVLADLAAGKHEIRFEFDRGLLDENAKLDPRSGGRPGQAERWPKPLLKQSKIVILPIEVVPPDVPAVTLVTDPKRDPSSAISITSIDVLPKDSKVAMKANVQFGSVPVPVLFKVHAEIDGKQYTLGTHGSQRQGSSYTSGWERPTSLPAGSKALTAKVVLEPDVKTAEDHLDWEEIWGLPITIPDVPLERYDLKEDEADAPSASSGPASSK